MVHEKNPHSDGLAVFDDMSCWIPCDFVLGYNLYLPSRSSELVDFAFKSGFLPVIRDQRDMQYYRIARFGCARPIQYQ
jgi:hypothetical protein